MLRNLENALQDFAGTAVIISHDRWFLDRVCTHILAFEGNGKVFSFDGNFQEYEADRARRLGGKATAGECHRCLFSRRGVGGSNMVQTRSSRSLACNGEKRTLSQQTAGASRFPHCQQVTCQVVLQFKQKIIHMALC